jgi:acetoin utilization deacetylase AcuC-like enzyme
VGTRAVYALCRPPGHHAAHDLYGGFCYLNNAAIAARYLQLSLLPEGGRTEIAILDFDYHHGNGTQALFYNDPTVLFSSLHADPENEYPYYWGHADERGVGAGEGFNLNYPLPLGTPDGPYLAALDQALAAIAKFDPRCLIVSAGFDIFTGDPVGGFKVTSAGIAQIGRAVAALDLPTLILQEGGYLREKLGENALAFLEQF